MKALVIVVVFLVLLVSLQAQEMKYANSKPGLSTIQLPGNANLSQNRDSLQYEFATNPMILLTSYWDYMPGAYNGLPLRFQQNSPNGTFLTFTGQRTATGTRRVFYGYFNHQNSTENLNEIGNNQIREGYSTIDIDPISGKPFYAWHSNVETNDDELEIRFTYDAFLGNAAGLLADPVTTLNNPTTIGTTTDNDFDWPVTLIGPSPLAGHRRVYIFTTNSVTHCLPANPSENVFIKFTDFTPEEMEFGSNDFTWQQTSIPTLNNWNKDQTAWRRFFQTPIIGNNGDVYLMGYRTGLLNDTAQTAIDDSLTIFINHNYAEGSWEMHSYYPNFEVPAPDTTGFVYCRISSAGHMSGCVKNDGKVSIPIIVACYTNDNHWYPNQQFLQEAIFDPESNTFSLKDIYPTGIYPNNGTPVNPWDINEDGVQDSSAVVSWPYVFWDETAVDNAMMFHYGNMRMTKMNSQGMMACVWSSSARARMYNNYPNDFPELMSFANVPEIFVSIYPIQGLDGPHWSEPISLNSIETSQFANMIPEWPYPADYIEYLGTNELGSKIGQLRLMFYDDNTWGASSIDPPVGQHDGGNVMFASLNIAFGPGSTTDSIDPTQAPTLNNITLNQNYPNPFNPETTISFNLKQPEQITLNIYNVKGQLIKTLIDDKKSSGNHEIIWNGKDNNGKSISAGIYLYKIGNGKYSTSKKMILMK